MKFVGLKKRLNIITGHYGSGKTTVSLNLARMEAGRGEMVTLLDLDTVNPYFRASEKEKELNEIGVKVISPVYANTNLDIPALPPEVNSVFEGDRTGKVIIDVGGDDAGALSLGQFSKKILSENDYDCFYVINSLRALTRTPEDAVGVLDGIRAACRVPATAVINNTNLGRETVRQTIEGGIPFSSEVSKLCGLPVAFTSVDEKLAADINGIEGILPIRIYTDPLFR